MLEVYNNIIILFREFWVLDNSPFPFNHSANAWQNIIFIFDNYKQIVSRY